MKAEIFDKVMDALLDKAKAAYVMTDAEWSEYDAETYRLADELGVIIPDVKRSI